MQGRLPTSNNNPHSLSCDSSSRVPVKFSCLKKITQWSKQISSEALATIFSIFNRSMPSLNKIGVQACDQTTTNQKTSRFTQHTMIAKA
jgi:hypothetical protein